jgi:subtilase family serine protease
MSDANPYGIGSAQLIQHELPVADSLTPQGLLPYPGYLTPPQIATAYGIPASTGAGVKIGIIAPLGGGFLQSDLNKCFVDLTGAGLIASGTPAPTIKKVLLDGVSGLFTDDPYNANMENTLDIYCIATLVPAADITIYLGLGFDGLISRAIADGCHILSISYAWNGEPGDAGSTVPSYESIFATAAAAKVAICCASGDSGATPTPGDTTVDIGYPSGSPKVISVGGTKLVLNTNNTRLSESDDNQDPSFGNTWGGGGGVSSVFSAPTWQTGLFYTPITNNVTGTPTALTMRGIPDISAPMNGYVLYYNGNGAGVGGTSASAPVMAGILARFQALTGKQRSSDEYNRLFYSNPSAFYDIIVGTNNNVLTSGYAGTQEWDAVTGLGPMVGDSFYKILTARNRFPKNNYGLRPTRGQIWPRTHVTTMPAIPVLTVNEAVYTANATWTCPAGVTSVSVLAVGGGAGSYRDGGGGGGGALAWVNDIPVTPGDTYTVVVGAAGASATSNNDTGDNLNTLPTAGGDSYFINSTTVRAGGGAIGNKNSNGGGGGAGGSYTVASIYGTRGGGLGGTGGNYFDAMGGGGGGAGGYTGAGGNGGTGSLYALCAGSPGAGGGGGGGAANSRTYGNGNGTPSGAGGGGVGILGKGTSGAGGVGFDNFQTTPALGGGGGSGGTNGGDGSVNFVGGNAGGAGGTYGGGAGSGAGAGNGLGWTRGNTMNGGAGAVRIIWGTGVSFPNNAGS